MIVHLQSVRGSLKWASCTHFHACCRPDFSHAFFSQLLQGCCGDKLAGLVTSWLGWPCSWPLAQRGCQHRGVASSLGTAQVPGACQEAHCPLSSCREDQWLLSRPPGVQLRVELVQTLTKHHQACVSTRVCSRISRSLSRLPGTTSKKVLARSSAHAAQHSAADQSVEASEGLFVDQPQQSCFS